MFSFLNVYVSVNTIFECSHLLFGWVISHPLRKYVTGVMGAASSKICTGAYKGRRAEKLVKRHVLTK